MGFVSFAGRALFASVFLRSVYQENLALSGALLFFLGVNNSIPKRKRKAPKTNMVCWIGGT